MNEPGNGPPSSWDDFAWLDDVHFDEEIDAIAEEIAPDTCPITVRSTPHPPVIEVSNPTPVESVLIQSLDLALTELSECRLAYQSVMKDLIEKEKALHEARGLIEVLRNANENLYQGLVLQKTQFQTILANQQVPVNPEMPS